MKETKANRKRVKSVTVPNIPAKVMSELKKYCKKRNEKRSKIKTEALILGFKEKGIIDGDVEEKD